MEKKERDIEREKKIIYFIVCVCIFSLIVSFEFI